MRFIDEAGISVQSGKEAMAVFLEESDMFLKGQMVEMVVVAEMLFWLPRHGRIRYRTEAMRSGRRRAANPSTNSRCGCKGCSDPCPMWHTGAR